MTITASKSVFEPVSAPLPENRTLLEITEERIAHLRDTAARMEATLYKLPSAVQRLTEEQARIVGVYFG